MASTSTTEEALTLWRRAMFEEMGFDDDAAQLLAETRHGGYLIDTHKVRKMLQSGCATDLALRIML